MENDLSSLLSKEVSSTRLDLVHRVADQASILGFPIYIVGGFVRDLLLGHPGLDFDLVVEGDAIALARALASRYGGKATLHGKFRTAKWLFDGHSTIDLISARSETYQNPAALPTVTMGSIQDDLRRRDFTINTLAIRLDGHRFGELQDKLGGLDDLHHGLIRVLHPHSFQDDPTRMYRAVRYEKRYGFKIAVETLALIPEARRFVDKLSAQRIRRELDLILDEPNAASMLARLNALDLLSAVHPVLRFDRPARARFESSTHASNIELSKSDHRDLRWRLWLMVCSTREIASLNKRLHFTASLLVSLLASSKLRAELPALIRLKPSQCVERLDKLPLPAISAVSMIAVRGKHSQLLNTYLSTWRHVKPKTTGHELKKLGLEPGPKYQVILRRLRDAWLDGEVKNAGEEKKLLDKILG